MQQFHPSARNLCLSLQLLMSLKFRDNFFSSPSHGVVVGERESRIFISFSCDDTMSQSLRARSLTHSRFRPHPGVYLNINKRNCDESDAMLLWAPLQMSFAEVFTVLWMFSSRGIARRQSRSFSTRFTSKSCRNISHWDHSKSITLKVPFAGGKSWMIRMRIGARI